MAKGTPYTPLFQKSDTLASGITDSANSFTLTTGNFGSPSGAQLYVIDYDNANAEVVSATVAGTAGSSVTRGLDGTSGVAHSAGAKVGAFFVPSHYTALKPQVTTETDTGSQTANSTTFVTAGISKSFTTTGGMVIAIASFSARTGTAGDFFTFRVKRDANVLKTSGLLGGGGANNERFHGTMFTIETPSAGTYTYDIEFNRASGSGTITAEVTDLMLIEVPA